jgi:cell division transport system permease protein
LQSEQIKIIAMAGKGTGSLKRSKPSYIASIVGVAIVLFIMGIMGWLFINLNTIGNNLKEDIRISVYLNTADKNKISQIQQYISSKPYAKNVEYIDKAKAKAIWEKENESVENIEEILPESIDFYANANYINIDSLNKISVSIKNQFNKEIDNIDFPKTIVTILNERATKLGLIFLVLSFILCTIVIISIDNTIRLAMFSNRFLIKTMQMVGATRWFIAKPFNIRSVINGIISAVIAIIGVLLLKAFAENLLPELKTLASLKWMIILCSSILALGIVISLLSTHRSVIKYLRTQIDDLY